jgi:hypothetical protein
MMHRWFGAALVLMLMSGNTHAQVLPGDSASPGIGAAVSNSRSRPVLNISRELYRERPEDDVAYRQAAKNIPDRKPAKDPWAGVRQAPAAAAPDRHRVQ